VSCVICNAHSRHDSNQNASSSPTSQSSTIKRPTAAASMLGTSIPAIDGALGDGARASTSHARYRDMTTRHQRSTRDRNVHRNVHPRSFATRVLCGPLPAAGSAASVAPPLFDTAAMHPSKAAANRFQLAAHFLASVGRPTRRASLLPCRGDGGIRQGADCLCASPATAAPPPKSARMIGPKSNCCPAAGFCAREAVATLTAPLADSPKRAWIWATR